MSYSMPYVLQIYLDQLMCHHDLSKDFYRHSTDIVTDPPHFNIFQSVKNLSRGTEYNIISASCGTSLAG